MGAQIALSVLLLGGAGLFVRTLENLRQQQVGFELGHLVTFGIDPTESGYEGDRVGAVMASALEAVGRIPGVVSVAGTTDPELEGNTNTSDFTVEGHKAAEEEDMDFEAPWITPGYFATLRQPLLAGREFTAGDAKTAPKVAVVSLKFAKRFFGSAQNALGRMVATGEGDGVRLDTTIVGVVGDVKHKDLRSDPVATVYRPYLQMRSSVRA